jgi:hypothetical protein
MKDKKCAKVLKYKENPVAGHESDQGTLSI